MNKRTVEILDDATRAFYEACASSFSDTRQAPWPGWRKLLDKAFGRGALSGASEGASVLDLGCGNMRFAKYLKSAFPDAEIKVFAVDRCRALAEDAPCGVHFVEADFAHDAKGALECVPRCDLAAAFGVMHHIPTPEGRIAILEALLEKTKPGGLACVSFWQFEKSPRILSKAEEATRRGCERLGIELDMDKGDYLLGWQDETDVFRYCHSFSDEEVCSYVSALGAAIVDDYAADGENVPLNRYVILRQAE